MSLLTDKEIQDLAESQQIISPFLPKSMRTVAGGPSFGLGSTGYDIRISDEFGFLKGASSPESGPMEWEAQETLFSHDCYRLRGMFEIDEETVWDPAVPMDDPVLTIRARRCVLDPGDHVLCKSLEEFNMPRDVMGLAFGKSSYARLGILVNVTPLEPGWKGRLTISVSNVGNFPVALRANEGIAQIIFLRPAKTPSVDYTSRGGKWQNTGEIAVI